MSIDQEFAQAFVQENVDALTAIPIDRVLAAAGVLDRARHAGRRVFVVGNGGSASTASHLACDLMKATARRGRPPVRVHCLVDHVPAITAWANDESFDMVFEAQLAVHAEMDDVLLVVTGSGRSPNVLRALEFARRAGMSTVGMLGMGGGPALDLCDVAVVAASDDYEVIENAHLVVCHLLTAFLREHGAVSA